MKSKRVAMAISALLGGACIPPAEALDLYVDVKTNQVYTVPGPHRVKLGSFKQVEETAEGMHCVGAPVFAAGRSDAVAAVAVSLIKASTSARRRDEVVAAIRDLAARLSQRLGA